MSSRSESDQVLHVLLSVPPARSTTNPYVVMLTDALRGTPGVEVHAFDWRFALTGQYDVFHAHWPENLVRGNGGLRTLGRHCLTGALLTRLRASGTPVVRTLHNIEPHERPSVLTRSLLRFVDRLTVATISLNAMTPALPGVPNEVIAHGHYQSWFERFARRPVERGRLISFGAIREYKNLPALASVISGIRDPGLRLTIAGPCSNGHLAQELVNGASGDDRVDIRLGYQSDEDLVAAVTSSELVVLPYREMHNSGAVLAALSLRRPVLVPSNSVTDALAEEVGSFWVRRYAGVLTSDAVRVAMQGAPPADLAPDLHARDWAAAGVRHLHAYRIALGSVRR